MLKSFLIGFTIIACPPLGVILFLIAYAPPRVNWADVRAVHASAGEVLRRRRTICPRPDLSESASRATAVPPRGWLSPSAYIDAPEK